VWVGSLATCMVLLEDICLFGWTTYVVMARRQTLAPAHTEAGPFIHVSTIKTLQYRAIQLYRVKANINNWAYVILSNCIHCILSYFISQCIYRVRLKICHIYEVVTFAMLHKSCNPSSL